MIIQTDTPNAHNETFEIVTITNGDLQQLVHTISSVLGQTSIDFIYSIVNGGLESILPSLPQTLLLDKRVRVIEKVDKSLWEGMNNAINDSTETWLLFMNAGDMFLDKHSVERMIKAVRSQPDIDAHYFDWYTFARSEDGRLERLKYRRPDSIEKLIVKLPFCHQAIWTRTKLLKQFKFTPVSHKQRQALDHGFYLRIWIKGAKFSYHPFATSLYAVGGLSDTRRIEALLGNAHNTCYISNRPITAIKYLIYQVIIQILALNPRILRSSKRYLQKIQGIFGLFVETFVWLGVFLSKPKSASSNVGNDCVNTLAVLVQFDSFAHSVADWVGQNSLLGQRTELLLSQRYGFKSVELCQEPIFVENFLTLRSIFSALLQSLLVLRCPGLLSDRTQAQINSSVIRRFAGKLNHQIGLYSFHRNRNLLTYVLMKWVAEQIIRKRCVSKLLINDLSYSHNYAFIKAAFDLEVPVFYYSIGFKDDQLFMRSATKEKDLIHCATEPDQCCRYPRFKLNAARQNLLNYYQKSMSQNTFAGSRGGWSIFDKDKVGQLSQRFKTDKNLIVIFSHVLFDANGAYGVDIFSSMESWLRQTLMWYRDFGDDNCFIVIKEHPANKFKFESVNGKRPLSSERLIYEELKLDRWPHRFGFLSDENCVSTAQVLQEAVGCITVRGSVAVEAAAHGIPVLVAGSSRFSGKYFVKEPNSQLEYFLALNDFFKIMSFTRGRLIARATRYAERSLYCGGVTTSPWHISHDKGIRPQLVKSKKTMENAN